MNCFLRLIYIIFSGPFWPYGPMGLTFLAQAVLCRYYLQDLGQNGPLGLDGPAKTGPGCAKMGRAVAQSTAYQSLESRIIYRIADTVASTLGTVSRWVALNTRWRRRGRSRIPLWGWGSLWGRRGRGYWYIARTFRCNGGPLAILVTWRQWNIGTRL